MIVVGFVGLGERSLPRSSCVTNYLSGDACSTCTLGEPTSNEHSTNDAAVALSPTRECSLRVCAGDDERALISATSSNGATKIERRLSIALHYCSAATAATAAAAAAAEKSTKVDVRTRMRQREIEGRMAAAAAAAAATARRAGRCGGQTGGPGQHGRHHCHRRRPRVRPHPPPPGLPSSLLALATCQSDALRERERERASSLLPLSPFIPSFLSRASARRSSPSSRARPRLPPSCRARLRSQEASQMDGAKKCGRRAERGGEGAKTNTVGRRAGERRRDGGHRRGGREWEEARPHAHACPTSTSSSELRGVRSAQEGKKKVQGRERLCRHGHGRADAHGWPAGKVGS